MSTVFAVIQIGNQQFRVAKDTIIETQLTGKKAGEEFETDQVLMVESDGQAKFGKPFLGQKVRLKVLADSKGPKLRGYFYRRSSVSARNWGHRQPLQRLQVLAIG